MKLGVYLGPAGQLVLVRRSPVIRPFVIQYADDFLPLSEKLKIPNFDGFVKFSLDGWEYLGPL
jgi:hypothetical protein